MKAGRHDFYIEQGTDFTRILTLKSDATTPLNLTGWTGRGQIRKTHSSDGVVTDLTVAVTDAAAGKVTISLTAEETADIEVEPAKDYTRKLTRYVYDVEMVKPSGQVIRVLEGTAEISPEVTKAVVQE